MQHTILSDWKLAYLDNKTVKAERFAPSTVGEVRARLNQIAASVPGNLYLDLMRENILPDLYYGTNVLLAQKTENLHLYYSTEFDYKQNSAFDDFLVFEGIDTIADIYLDGKKIGRTENMLHEHRFALENLSDGKHELLVHILPTSIYARQFDLPATCFGLQYNHDSLEIRKAPYTFGWDIMPRTVTGGIWKPVLIESLPKNRLLSPFTYTVEIKDGQARLKTTVKVISEEDFLCDFSVIVEIYFDGALRSKTVRRCFCANMRIDNVVQEPKLWFPKNYGMPYLYDVKVSLWQGEKLLDEHTYRTGIRTVRLKRTSRSGDDGDFCFEINGKRIFCLGTNYVPTDAHPSRQKDYDERALELANDVGCNMIRFWGGNIYPSERVYDFCDENGIMVWQDFAFGCGHYPDDERLCRLTKEEVEHVASAYRNHPSLVVYAGDNECDVTVCQDWECEHAKEGPQTPLDPNENVLTRDVILHELRNHDATRPYLPSSPYLDSAAYLCGLPSEDHLWGPRDYFKGDFYKNPVCHFASEIGYHGCNSPESLKKFIPEDSLNQIGTSSRCSNHDWLVHAAGVETTSTEEGNPYAYRIPLMISQVERIFIEKENDLALFAKQSQISQAEADKYFIEKFRSEKWRKTGIVWWNIIDGWPQISDAVVDWYGCKKLAYSYIKRAQRPFVMIIGEPENGAMPLYAINDLQKKVSGTYSVKDVLNDKTICKDSFDAEPDSKTILTRLPEADHAFYYIEWHTQDGKGVNHHACSLGEKWNFEDYLKAIERIGFDEFEGF